MLEKAERVEAQLSPEQIARLHYLITTYPKVTKFPRDFFSPKEGVREETLPYAIVKLNDNYFLVDNQKISNGAFGKVKKSLPLIKVNNHFILSDEQRAIKIIPVLDDDRGHIRKINLEYKIVQTMYDSYGILFRNSHGRTKAYLDMPYFDPLDLINVKKIFELGTPEVLLLCILATQELKRLHDNNFIHNDLKPQHILYNRKDHQIKIIDFGCARYGLEEKYSRLTGTDGYMAPEIFDFISSKMADIFALGQTFRHLLELPLKNSKPKTTIPNHLSILNFIERMMAADSKDRPQTLDEVQEFFANALYAEKKAIENYNVKIKQKLNGLKSAIMNATDKLQQISNTKYADCPADNPQLTREKSAILDLKKSFESQVQAVEDKIKSTGNLQNKDYKTLKQDTLKILDNNILRDVLESSESPIKQVCNTGLRPVRYLAGTFSFGKNFARFGIFKHSLAETLKEIENDVLTASVTLASVTSADI